MTKHSPTHTNQAPGGDGPPPVPTTSEILAVIEADEPHGATTDHVARTIGLGLDGAVVQGELEDLVARGLLDRRGLGHGALCTLNAASRG